MPMIRHGNESARHGVERRGEHGGVCYKIVGKGDEAVCFGAQLSDNVGRKEELDNQIYAEYDKGAY